jgi:anti-anti-sigma regulatory factor
MSGGTAEQTVELPAVADLTFARTLKEMLAQALAARAELKIDASQVQRIGSPCLQVLVSATNACGSKPTFVDPSTEFIETVSILGLDSVLGLRRE